MIMHKLLSAVAILTVAFTPARADDPAPKLCDAKAAFEKLKSLEGDWSAQIADVGHDTPPAKFNYKITSNGSAVVETLFAGSEHEMMTVYFLEGDNLVLTHYCHQKNQPHCKLDRAKSTPDHLIFAFDGGSNFDPAKDVHMHDGSIAIKSPKLVEATWNGYAGGKPTHSAKFSLSR
jgi:hypothetical protein